MSCVAVLDDGTAAFPSLQRDERGTKDISHCHSGLMHADATCVQVSEMGNFLFKRSVHFSNLELVVSEVDTSDVHTMTDSTAVLNKPCDSVTEFQHLAQLVNSACCDDDVSSCTDGVPAYCSPTCWVLTSHMQTACHAFSLRAMYVARMHTILFLQHDSCLSYMSFQVWNFYRTR